MEILRYDTLSSDGSDNVTKSILKIINSYPLLEDTVEFQTLDTTKGKAMIPSPSVAVIKEDIIGRKTCIYDFLVVYRTRASATNIEKIKEWLDNLGRWLESLKYPALENEINFEEIKRKGQSYLGAETTDKAQDWIISLRATYTE